MSGFNFRNRADAIGLLELLRQRSGPQVERRGFASELSLSDQVDSLIVQTPVAGIAARSGTTPGSEDCTPYFINDAGTLTELTSSAGDAQSVTVYNLSTSAVAGSDYIQPSLVLGKLVVKPADGALATFYRFTLNAAWSMGVADSDIFEMNGTDTGTDDDVHDPLGIFTDMGVDDEGICFLQGGTYYAIQAPCGTA